MLLPPIIYALFSSTRHLWKNRAVRIVVLLSIALYSHFAAFLAIYKSVRKIHFDFYFLRYNLSDAVPTLWKLFAPWFPVVLLSILAFIFLQTPAFSTLIDGSKRPRRKTITVLAALFLFSASLQLATIRNTQGSAAGFLYTNFFSDRRLRNDYTKLFAEHINALRSDPPKVNGSLNPSVMGDAIFFIKQESLNGFLAGPQVTPQLMHAMTDGILFTRVYANSIQSLRGYGCILCGVPPSITSDIADDYPPGVLNELDCLPKIFKSLGYHPLYFFGGSRNARIIHFAESIGFEKVLSDEIVQPGDFKFDWGYREDIYFGRVLDYLRKNFAGKKIFAFIDTGATNHTPFHVLDEAMKDEVPYPQAENFEQHLSNATFVQDAYFGQFYDAFREDYGERGSLVVVSDHAWPIRMHKDNIYNERGAYEENFLIPMLIVPPRSLKDRFATGTVCRHRFSQMDIVPTILEMIGMERRRLLGESFAPWLLRSPVRLPQPPQKTKISVQPYGGGFISVVRYPEKYLFDVLGKNVKVYDLDSDPGEQSPSVLDVGKYMPLIRNFFHN